MNLPIWKRSRVFRFACYGLLILPLCLFHLYEGLILLALIGFVVEFACFPGKQKT
ncbi:MAG: hypothetical protein PVG22_07495 [Chromatiales bacterium]|jgi:hypothetical protein